MSEKDDLAVVSIGKTAEEIHADLISENQDATLADVEEKIDAMVGLGFLQRADLSVGEAVEILQRDTGRRAKKIF